MQARRRFRPTGPNKEVPGENYGLSTVMVWAADSTAGGDEANK